MDEYEQQQHTRERIVKVEISRYGVDFYFENDPVPYVAEEFVRDSPTRELMDKIVELFDDYNEEEV